MMNEIQIRPSTPSRLVGIALVFAAAIAPGSKGEELTAAEILDRADRNQAPPEIRNSIVSHVYKGTVEFKGMAGMKGAFVETFSSPLKARVTWDLGVVVMDEGTDGEVVWEKNPTQGVTIHSGSGRELKLRGYAGSNLIPWRKIYKEARLLGREKIEGREHFKLELTPWDLDGTVQTVFVDTETLTPTKTHLLLRETPGVLGGGEIPIAITYGDYRRVDGVLYFHQRTINVGVMQVVLKTESIERNPKVDESRFELPDDVRKAAKSAGTEKASTDRPSGTRQ